MGQAHFGSGLNFPCQLHQISNCRACFSQVQLAAQPNCQTCDSRQALIRELVSCLANTVRVVGAVVMTFVFYKLMGQLGIILGLGMMLMFLP